MYIILLYTWYMLCLFSLCIDSFSDLSEAAKICLMRQQRYFPGNPEKSTTGHLQKAVWMSLSRLHWRRTSQVVVAKKIRKKT